MKNSFKIAIILFAFIFTSQITKAQECTTAQMAVTKGTMGSRTNKAVFIGQSFTACKIGKLTKVTFRIGGGNQITDIELRVFKDKKIAKKPLFKQNTTLPTPENPPKNYEDVVIKLENGVVAIEEGKTYTVGFFKKKSRTKKLLRFKSDITNSFKNGSLVANSKIPGGKR